MLLRNKIFSLAFLSFLVFSPVSEVIRDVSNVNSENLIPYSLSNKILANGLEDSNDDLDLAIYTCNDITSTFSDFSPDPNQCGPRSVTWTVRFRFPVEDVANPASYRVRFFWDTDNDPFLYDQVIATWTTGAPGLPGYQASYTKVYPDDGDICTYNAKAQLFISGVALCTNAKGFVLQQIEVYDDIANTNLGNHDVDWDPTSAGVEVGEKVEICRGDNSVIRLDDISTFNCTPPLEVNTPNTQSRWVQWVYGSTNTVNTGGIAAPNSEKIAINGVYYDDSELPVYGEPEYLPANVTAPNSNTLDVQMPIDGTTAGQTFEVTLRSWNLCNQFDNNEGDGGLNPDQGPMTYDIYDATATPGGGSPTRIDGGSGSYYASDVPIERTFDIEIVNIPAQLTVTDQKICVGDAIPILTVGNIDGGATEINWYDDNKWSNPAANLLDTGAPPNNFDPSAHGASSAAAGAYSYWVTQRTGGALNCESEPVEVTLEVYDNPVPDPSYAIVSGAAQCDAVTLDLDASGTTNTVPGQTTYFWEIDDNSTFSTPNYTVGPQTSPTSSGLVVNHLGAATNRRTWNIRLTVTNPASDAGCQVITEGVDFYTYLTPTLSTTGDETICSGETTNIDLSHNSNSNTNQRYNWTVVTSGAVGDLTGASNGGPENHPYTIAQTLTNNTNIPQTASYTITVTNVQDGQSCQSVAEVVTVTVNPTPPKPTITETGDGLTICEDGSSTILESSDVGSTAAIYEWYESSDLVTPIQSGASNTLTRNTVAQSGTYYVKVIGIAPTNCESVLSDPVVVTISPLPTATVSGGGSVCAGNPAPDIVWNLTGTPPYDFTITLTPGAPIVETGYNSNTYTISAPNPGVNTDYEMTALQDANTCNGTSLGGAASVAVVATPPPTIASFTPGPDVCHDGGAATAPVLTLDLDPDLIQDYDITFSIYDSGAGLIGNQTVSKTTDIFGVTSIALDYAADLSSTPDTYEVRITSIVNTITLCNAAGLPASRFITINPDPADPTNPVNNIACETGGGVALSVDAPLAGNIIHWYQDAALTTEASLVGTVSGGQDEIFTPTSSATATFYAVVESTTAPTNCQSLNSVAVTQTEDQQPSAANAEDSTPIGTPPAVVGTCDDTFVLNATAADNGGTGTWTASNGSITFDNDNDPNTTARNIPLGTYTFTWTVDPALGACASSSDNYDVTRHTLPAANDHTADFCEVQPQASDSYDVTALDLSSFDDSVTGIVGSTDRTVTYFTDPGLTTAVVAPYTVSDNDQIYARVVRTDVVPNCESSSTVTFNIITLPDAIDQDDVVNAAETEFCEDFPVGSGTKTGIDLTDLDNDVVNNLANRTVVWFTDAGYSVAVPDPTNASATNGTVFYPRVEETASGSGCYNYATTTITVNTRPADNPIQGANTQCVGGSTSLYQVNPGPAGTTYNWNIPADFTVFGGGTINDFFVLLQFPVVTTQDLEVTEISPDGCDGNLQSMTITVQGSPPISAITGPAAVCAGETGVAYSVTNTANTTYAWSVPTGASIILGQGTSSIIVNFGTSGGNVQVIPTSSGGCSGGTATLGVTVNQLPILDPNLSATVCSDDDISITLAADGSSPVAAATYDITASVSPGLIANTGPTTGNGLTSAAIFNDNYTNTTGGPLTVTYTVTPVSADNCDGSSVNVIATIDPEPVLASGLDVTECSDVAIGLDFNTAAGSVAAASYNLVNVTIPGALTPGGTNAVFPQNGVAFDYVSNDTYTNTGNTPLVVQYEVEPVSASACAGNSLLINATIDPEPVMSTTLDDIICSDLPIGVTLNTNGVSVAAAQYFLADVSIPGGVTASGTNAAFPAISASTAYITNDSYTNTTTLPVDVIYEIEPISADGCRGDSEFITITINPEPVVNGGITATVCSDDVSGITLASLGTAVAAADYNYVDVTIPAGITAAGTNAVIPANNQADNYIINDSYTNQTNAQVAIVYEIQGVSVDGCISDSEFITLNVDPEPVIDPALDATVCSDEAIGLNFATAATSVAAVSYDLLSVTPDAGLIADAGNVILANGVLASYVANDKFTNTTNASLTVTYEVRGTAGGTACVGDSEFIVITINPEPVMSTSLNTIVCSDDAIGVVFANNGTSIAAANYNVVNVTIPAGLTAGGSNVAFPANGVASGYISSDTYTNQTMNPIIVTYDVQGVSGAGCIGDEESILITINPEPVISTTLDATVCSDDAIGLTLNTNGSSVAAANYNIIDVVIPAGLTTGANAVVPANGVAANYLAGDTYTNQTNSAIIVTYEVRGVSASPCVGDSEFINITIDPEPVIDNALDATVCSNEAIGLVLGTDAASVPAQNYDIVNITIAGGLVAGGSNALFPAAAVGINYVSNDTYQNPTSAALTVVYTVRGTSAKNCVGDTEDITITIDPEPLVSPTLDKTVCSDDLINITLSTVGTSAAAVDYNIKSISIPVGVTAAGTNAVVPANNIAAGYIFNDSYNNKTSGALVVTYEVTGTSADGCEGVSEFIDVTVNPEPVIDPALSTTVCSDEVTGVTLTTDGSSVAAATFNIIDVVIDASLTAGGGNVAFPANGVAAAYFSNDTYTNLTSGPLNVVYEVRGVSGNSCVGDSEFITITVNPEPVIDPGLDDTVCSDEVIGLNFATAGTSVAAANYDFLSVTPDASLVVDPGNAVLANGVAAGYVANDKYTNSTNGPLNVTYEIRGTAGGTGCIGDSEFIVITINPEPVMSTSLNTTVCSDDVIGVVFANNGTSVAAANYNVVGVTIPAGLTAGGGNVAFPANGVATGYISSDTYTNQTMNPIIVTYDVQGVSADGCIGDVESIDVTIDPEPVISTSLDATVCSDDAIGLTLNTNGTSVVAANYNIINVVVPAGLTAGANAVVPANGVAANYLSADTYTNQTNSAITVTYEVQGVSAAPCVGDSEFIDIIINPEPVVSSTLNTTVCSDEIIGVNLATDPSAVGAADYNIVGVSITAGLTPAGTNAPFPVNGVAFDYIANDSYTNLTNGALTVTYDVQGVSVNNCIGDIRSIVVTIDPEPVIDAGLDAAVCSDLPIGLTFATNGTSVAAANYNLIDIQVGAGLIAGGANVVPANGINANYVANDLYTNTTNASIDVTYEVIGVSADNCLGDPLIITMTINPEPTMNAGLDQVVCSDDLIALNLSDDGLGIAATTFNVVDVTIPAGLTAGGGNAVFPANNVAGNYLASDEYNNVTALPIDVTYEVRGVSALGCIGDSEFIIMTIDPEPVISNSLDATVCSDEATNVTLNTNGTSVAAANYNIVSVTIPAGLTAGGGNSVVPANAVPATYIQNDTYTNQTNGDIVVSYVVEGTSADNCLGDQQTINVTISPEPVINAGLDDIVCSDAVTGLVLNTDGVSIGASNYNIINVTIDPGLTAGGGNAAFPANGVAAAYLSSDVFTNTTSTPLDVIYEVSGVSFSACEGDSRLITISIEPGPIVDPNLDVTLCSETPIGVTLGTDVGSVAATAYNVLSITPNPSLIPGGGNVPAANNVASNYIFNDTYTNTTSIPLTVSYEVKGVSAATCRGPSEFIVVTIDPEPVIDPGLDKTVCSDEAVGLILNTNGVSVGANTYNVISVSVPVGVTADAGNAAVPATGVVDGYLSNDKYTNVTNGPLVVTYEARGESASTCEGQSRFINITIDPEPVVDPSLDVTVCSDEAVGVTLATNGSSVAAANYNILTVTPDVGLTASGSNVAIPANGVVPGYFSNDQFTNKTNGPLNVIYEVQGVSADNCIGDSEFITVTIDPEPVIDAAITNTVCSDENIAINLGTDASSVNASTYDVLSVSIPAGLTAGANAVIPAMGVGIGYLSADNYTNLTATPLDVTYEVRGTSLAGCTGDSEFISVRINAEPVLNPSLDAIVCSDEVSGIKFTTNGTSVTASTYNLISVTPQAGLIADPGNALPALGQLDSYIQNDRYTNTSNIDLTVQYVVEPVSALNCIGDQATITLTIHPEPVLDPALSPAPVCSDVASGVVLSEDAGSIAAASYNIVGITWDSGLAPGGSNASIGNGQAANAIAGDTYTNTSNVALQATYDIVPVSADNCLGDVQQVIFTVNPAPALSTSLDETVCSDQATGVVLATNGVSTPAANYEIQSVVATGLTPGVGNTALPITTNNTMILSADTYTNPTDNTLTAVYAVVPISGAGCRGPLETITVTVEPTITAVATNTLPTICSNSTTDITLSSPTTPSAGNIVFNITAVGSSPSVSGYIPALSSLPQGYVIADYLVNTGNTAETVTYTITPMASGAAGGSGCAGTAIVEVVTVDPLPIITAGQFDVLCSDNAVNYTILTQNNLAGTTYTWPAPTVSDPGLTGGAARAVGSDLPISDTFTNTTAIRQSATYDVTPTGPSGCVGATTQITIFVDPTPVGTIAVDNPVVCLNGSALLSFNMSVGVAPFEIVYSDGTTDFTVSNIANTHFIAKNGLTTTTTYTLKSIQDGNGCAVTLTGESVTVEVEDPIADFTADITEDCTPLLVTFTNNDIQAGTQYEWNWGDGSPVEVTSEATVSHEFINNSTVSDLSYNVLLTATRTNGAVVCTSTDSEFITINAGVNLSVTPSTTEGCSPLLVSFINNSQGVLDHTWFWREQGTTDQNDITTVASASFVLNNLSTTTQTYEIVYQGDRFGCGDEVITEVTVYPELSPDFTVTPGTTVSITDPTITVTNNTLNKNSWDHLWEWGDGSTSTDVDPGSHTYASYGNYLLKLTITDPDGNCIGEQYENITVEPVIPEVDFEVDITEGCRPLTVTFTNLSLSVDPDTYLWEFKDQHGRIVGTSKEENPSFTFYNASIINVSLSGSNALGIVDTETKLELIEVYEIPTASFTVSPETVYLPDQLLFTSNLSALSDYWAWDFNGDGEVEIEGDDADAYEPQYKYEDAGVFNISLIATNTATTCSDTLLIEKAVTVIEGGAADIPNGFFPGSGSGSGGNPGGPGGSGAPNSVFLPRIQGVRDDGFLMQVFDRWGHLLFESTDKTVGWSGRDNGGKLYPVGVYVYKLELVYTSGQQATIVGDVTLIR